MQAQAHCSVLGKSMGRCATDRPQSELWGIFRRGVGYFPIVIKSLAWRLGNTIAQLITQLGTRQLALLAKRLQPHGIGREFINRRQWLEMVVTKTGGHLAAS
ncbi:TPA: hypothetical protein L3916_001903 [Pseudomonas aeruginosa]|nr:hypothetical protein [Pseudomonas aeruginosa]